MCDIIVRDRAVLVAPEDAADEGFASAVGEELRDGVAQRTLAPQATVQTLEVGEGEDRRRDIRGPGERPADKRRYVSCHAGDAADALRHAPSLGRGRPSRTVGRQQS